MVGHRQGRAAARALTAWLAGESRYKCCIVAGGEFLGRNTARDTGDDTALCAGDTTRIECEACAVGVVS